MYIYVDIDSILKPYVVVPHRLELQLTAHARRTWDWDSEFGVPGSQLRSSRVLEISAEALVRPFRFS